MEDKYLLILALIAFVLIGITMALSGWTPASCKGSLAFADHLTGPEFEQWCASLLRRLGYHDVRVLGGAGDQGGDILARKSGKRYVIQCKRYSHKLGNKPVQEVNAAVEIYHGDIAVVMTNQYFTRGGIEAARKCDVVLWDRDQVQRMIEEAGEWRGA